MDDFSIGIIGAGRIASKFCSAAKALGFSVNAVASKSADKACKFSSDNSIPRFYSSYDEMLEREELSLVYIATTNNFHKENASLALEHGVNILVEKPFALKYSDAISVFSAAKERNLFAMEAMWSRFLPAINKAKSWIFSGAIGSVKAGSYTAGIIPFLERITEKTLGGGALYDIGVYAIEIITYLMNQKLMDVISDSVFSDGIDRMDALVLRFEDSYFTVSLTLDAAIPASAVIYGTKGKIIIRDVYKADTAVLSIDGNEEVFCRCGGFEGEIMEAVSSIRKGLKESRIIPSCDTLLCARIFDKVISGIPLDLDGYSINENMYLEE